MSDGDKKATILDFDKVLGLKLSESKNPSTSAIVQIPDEVKKLVESRDAARAEKDFAKSDELRQKIESLGFEVSDTLEGTKIDKL